MNKKQLIYVLGACVAIMFVITMFVLIKVNNYNNNAQNADLYKEYETAEIIIEKGPCFGFCPSYIMTIDQDGNVTFDGRIFVKYEGETRKYKIEKDAVRKMLEEFKNVDFFSLEDEYVDQFVTDLPSLSITLKLDTESKTIFLYGLEDTVPEKLISLAEQIINLAEAKDLEIRETNFSDL